MGHIAAMPVRETYFTLVVAEMQRAIAFHVDALGANVTFASPTWSSLVVAGVRIGLCHDPGHETTTVGLHFAVDDLAAAMAAVARAGGRTGGAGGEVAPGVIVAEAADTEGNTFTLRQG